MDRGNDRPAIEARNNHFRMPTVSSLPEGHMTHDDNCEPCFDPARSKTLGMSGSFLYRSWEISSVPVGVLTGGADKAYGRKPAAYVGEKSDTPVVPEKPQNKGIGPAEVVEERGVAKGNADETPASRTQSRIDASMGLEGVRQKALLDRRARLTSLSHASTCAKIVATTPTATCSDKNSVKMVGYSL